MLLACNDVLAASLLVLLAVEEGTTEDRMFADGRAVKPAFERNWLGQQRKTMKLDPSNYLISLHTSTACN